MLIFYASNKNIAVIEKLDGIYLLTFDIDSKEQKSALENIKLLYESRQAVIKLFNDYSSIASEAKSKVKYGEELKI